MITINQNKLNKEQNEIIYQGFNENIAFKLVPLKSKQNINYTSDLVLIKMDCIK